MIELKREPVTEWPASEHLRRMAAEGWKLAAIEWQREAPAAPPRREPVPFGMRVGPDCASLEEDPGEQQALLAILDLLVQERTLTQVAEELNRRGLRTRSGESWTPVAVFELHPRLIEACPRLIASPEWVARSRVAAR